MENRWSVSVAGTRVVGSLPRLQGSSTVPGPNNFGLTSSVRGIQQMFLEFFFGYKKISKLTALQPSRLLFYFTSTVE